MYEFLCSGPKDQLGIIGDPGINLTRFLTEMFGRAPRSQQERLLFNSGPFVQSM